VLLIRGQQGCGKSSIIEFIANKVFGDSNSSIIQNAALDLFSRFANAAIDKSLVVLDEVRRACCRYHTAAGADVAPRRATT
jgi:hypothetical protein